MSDTSIAVVSAVSAALITGTVTYVVAQLRIKADVALQTAKLEADAKLQKAQLEAEIGLQKTQLEAEISRQKDKFDSDLRLQEERLRVELRTQFMAEAAIHQLLSEAEAKRSFEVIEKRLGGFRGDELRQLLIRSGAVRFERDTDGKELWGLRERNRRVLEGDR
ncbi:hypothetical protein ACIRST_38260 [Kitasatospora sp. NPDC101447]|uniref:hypothetical protein n=1 Tax=Kitasatospora sp. NPDC101447 TaxID=3364102 RepID=UPI003800F598